jgi:hypothetical protein
MKFYLIFFVGKNREKKTNSPNISARIYEKDNFARLVIGFCLLD